LNLQNDLLFFYADLFTGGNLKKAHKIMIPKQEMRKYDIARLNFVGGVLFAVLLAFIIAHRGKNRSNTLINGFPAG